MQKKAQSTVEYILLVTAVIGVVVFATQGPGSMFQLKLTNTINMSASGMENAASRLTAITP